MYFELFNIPNDLKYTEIAIAIAILVIISVLIIRISSFIINRLTKKFDIELTLSYLLKDLVKYIVLIGAITVVLEIFGIDVTSIVWSLGIIGISVGFAGRDMISNFISGIFILADKTVKVGEKIEVNGVVGKVHKVGFRTTTLISSDNLIITVPNLVLSKNPYTNYTYLDEHRIDLDILVSYDEDLIELKKELLKIFNNLDWVVEDSTPRIDTQEFIDDGIKLQVSVWAEDYSKRFDYKLDLANEIRILLNKKNN